MIPYGLIEHLSPVIELIQICHYERSFFPTFDVLSDYSTGRMMNISRSESVRIIIIDSIHARAMLGQFPRSIDGSAASCAASAMLVPAPYKDVKE